MTPLCDWEVNTYALNYITQRTYKLGIVAAHGLLVALHGRDSREEWAASKSDGCVAPSEGRRQDAVDIALQERTKV